VLDGSISKEEVIDILYSSSGRLIYPLSDRKERKATPTNVIPKTLEVKSVASQN
jgi:hypothetical protein